MLNSLYHSHFEWNFFFLRSSQPLIHTLVSRLVSQFHKTCAQSIPCANARLTISKALRNGVRAAMPCWFDATWFDAESAWWLDYRWSSWCCCYFYIYFYLMESCKICADLRSNKNEMKRKKKSSDETLCARNDCLAFCFLLFTIARSHCLSIWKKMGNDNSEECSRSMSNMWRRWPNLILFV